MAQITQITAREILDSRGYPTVSADVYLSDGTVGSAAIPSGASTGSHEALELRDGGERYNGKGVLKAVANVERLTPLLKGMDIHNVRDIDQKMLEADGTENKTNLGANATLAVSMAALRAGSLSAKTPLYEHIRNVYGLGKDMYILPAPMLNIINGGKHADSGLDVQEFMIVPTAPATFKEALRQASETYHSLRSLLKSQGMVIAVGDEGGFAPKISKHEDVLKTILTAAKNAGHDTISLAMDCAASEFFKDGQYRFEGRNLTSDEISAVYADWCTKYPIVSIEDPLQEDDWSGWEHITRQLGSKIRLVGDDLFVTNPKRLRMGIEKHAANAILIKVNQIGTVTETIDVMNLAKKHGYVSIVSHRSGETEDTFIADLAVATNAGAIKTGAPARTERTAKYNRLLQIEAELGSKAVYAQDKVFRK
ncbi:MAG: phosphopyruvate hydratase [Elusimicrobiaceae bacterium]|nr:phosphopyruvate hydratase [Elusimicrobiaceae bacterium]